MRTFSTCAALVVAISLSGNSNAQVSDFLIPVNAAEESVARGNNDYFIKRNTYWSKQHRIVKVNYSLLIEAKRFRIEFFDGHSIIVETEEIKPEQNGKTIRWIGNIVEPNYSLEYLTQNGFSREDAEFVRPRLRRVSITASEVSFDPTLRLKHQYFHRDFERFRSPLGQRGDSYDVNATFFIASDLSRPADVSKPGHFAAQYILLPFDMAPGYHLLFEEDSSKKYPGVSRDEETPEISRKRLEYEEFLRSLGPNPVDEARNRSN